MKATLLEPEIGTCWGKLVSAILPVKDYEELVERAEDAADLAWLKRARSKPQHYRPLEEYLAVRRRNSPRNVSAQPQITLHRPPAQRQAQRQACPAACFRRK